MKLFLKILLICSFFFQVTCSIFAQEGNLSFKQDTSEYIIEYDTVFVNPDTIKITDTVYRQIEKKQVVQTDQKEAQVKNQKPYFLEINFSPSFSKPFSFPDPNLGGAKYNTNQPTNIQLAVDAGTNYGNYFFKIGWGLTAITEKINKSGTITTRDSIDYQDSVLYYKKIINIQTSATNHFYYSGLSFSFGYKWIIKKIDLEPEITLGYYFKIPTKPIAIDTSFKPQPINSGQITDFVIPLKLQTAIVFKVIQHIQVSFGPFFQINFKQNRIPLTSDKMYGITMGLRYFK